MPRLVRVGEGHSIEQAADPFAQQEDGPDDYDGDTGHHDAVLNGGGSMLIAAQLVAGGLKCKVDVCEQSVQFITPFSANQEGATNIAPQRNYLDEKL